MSATRAFADASDAFAKVMSALEKASPRKQLEQLEMFSKPKNMDYLTNDQVHDIIVLLEEHVHRGSYKDFCFEALEQDKLNDPLYIINNATKANAQGRFYFFTRAIELGTLKDQEKIARTIINEVETSKEGENIPFNAESKRSLSNFVVKIIEDKILTDPTLRRQIAESMTTSPFERFSYNPEDIYPPAADEELESAINEWKELNNPKKHDQTIEPSP